MQSTSGVALKEWAVVCAALAAGRQTILLRKGGLAEGPLGFAVTHHEFWLFATRFHQSADELSPVAQPLLAEVLHESPPSGCVRLPLYVTVEAVHQLDCPQLLLRLAELHILAPETVDARFHYKRPGLSVLTVRAYRPPRVCDIPDSPHFAGCHSWVHLPADLPTAGVEPVLSDEDFALRFRTSIVDSTCS